jgi:hypothetical protein
MDYRASSHADRSCCTGACMHFNSSSTRIACSDLARVSVVVSIVSRGLSMGRSHVRRFLQNVQQFILLLTLHRNTSEDQILIYQYGVLTTRLFLPLSSYRGTRTSMRIFHKSSHFILVRIFKSHYSAIHSNIILQFTPPCQIYSPMQVSSSSLINVIPST